MSDTGSLESRLDAEFTKAKAKLESFQVEQAKEFHAKQERMAEFERTLDRLKDVIRPKLELLAKRFGDHVQIKPTITPGRRQAVFAFKNDLATIELQFSASADPDVRQVIFTSDLLILPIFIQYERHVEKTFPLGQVNAQELTDWLDERILSFVRTYFAMHENRQYWKDHLVRDPVAGIDFPRFAAAASLEHNGQTVYFSSLDTRDAYANLHGISET